MCPKDKGCWPRLHIQTDHNGQKYKCYICPGTYRTHNINDVVEHLFRTHGVKTETYKETRCSRCDWHTLTGGQAQLNFHYKMLHNEEYDGTTCKICGRRCASKFALNLHVQTVHMKVRPYQCDQCPIGRLYFFETYRLLRQPCFDNGQLLPNCDILNVAIVPHHLLVTAVSLKMKDKSKYWRNILWAIDIFFAVQASQFFICVNAISQRLII